MENGDYLRVDYNPKEKRVRLYVEIQDEGGSPYYAVIKDGKVTIERSVMSGRSSGFSEKFRERAHIYSTISNKDVLKIINNNYGISRSQKSVDTGHMTDVEHKKRLEETRKRYFVAEKNPYAGGTVLTGTVHGRVRFLDFVDFAVGWALALGLFFYFQYNFVVLGVVAALFGLVIGLTDIFIRERQPLVIKILFFICTGIASYVYGYYLM